MSETPPPQNVVEKQKEAPTSPVKSAESGPKASLGELRKQRSDIILGGKAAEGALTYFAIKAQKAELGGDADTKSRAETSRMAATASVIESAQKQADTENQIRQTTGNEPVPFNRDALVKQYRGESAQQYLDKTLAGTHQMDTGVLAREQSDQMYADVAKEAAGEKQKVNGKPEQDIWKGQAEKAAKLAGLAFAELGDKDVAEPQALGAALDVADKSGIYDKVKSKFLGAVDKRLHLANPGEADKLIAKVENFSAKAANDIRESRRAA
jgi:hypothetical protein